MYFCYSYTDNLEMLKQRLKSLYESRAQLDDDLKKKVVFKRSLEREMNSLNPEIKSLISQRDRLIGRITKLGVSAQRINRYLTQDATFESPYGSMVSDTDSWPHHDERTWLLREVDRPKADELLKGQPDGTFLIRLSSTSASTERYALSIQ